MVTSRRSNPGDFTRVLSLCIVAFAAWLAVSTTGFNTTVAQTTKSAAVKTGYVNIGKARMYYEEAGEGRPLVLIHGGLLNCHMWDDQFEILARTNRVIRYDVRWHGKSRSPRGAYADHEDLHALLDHLKIDKAVVMGLSLGGRIAIDYTLAHPERVSALIPVAPGLSGFTFPDTAASEEMAGFRAALQQGDFDRATELAQRMWTDGPQRTPEQVDAKLRERVRLMLREGVKRAGFQQQGLLLNPPAIGRLAEIHVPTLVIVGDRDVPDIMTIVGLLERDIPGVKKVVIPGAAHMVNMEKPTEFTRAVLDFLKDK